MTKRHHLSNENETERNHSQESDFVSLKELAGILGLDRSNTRKYVLGLGYKPHKRRTADSRSQLTLTLSRAEAEAVIEKRQEQGFIGGKSVVSDCGFFYVIQLVPEIAPQRVKLGFASTVLDRLQQHRTAAPTADLLKSWPCRKTWELTAMDSLTRQGCRLIANEVFDCDDLDALLGRGDHFFQQLPSPEHSVPLDDASPLRSEE